MSPFVFALAEKRLASFLLTPLSLAFGVATWVAVRHMLWWAGGVFVLLIVYMGWLTTALVYNRGKSFRQLRREIVLPDEPDPSGELTDAETWQLARTTVHVKYALIIAIVVGMLSLRVQWYWTLLVTVVAFLLIQPVLSLGIALASMPKRS